MDINDLSKYRLTEVDRDQERMKWESIDDGDRPEMAVLQIDIVEHSKILANDATLQRIKIEVRHAIQNTAHLFGGRLLGWEGDGGAFMFLTGKGQGFNRSVATALTMYANMPIINEDLKETTDLQSPIHIRLSVGSGTVSYSRDASTIHAQFLNTFLKNERAIGVADTVCITHEVWRQLDQKLQNEFQRRSFSKAIGCDIYQYGLGTSASRYETPVTDEPAESLGRGSFQQKKRNLKRFPNWPLLLAPMLSLILVIGWHGVDAIVVGIGIIPSLVLVNWFLAWRKSRRESAEDQSLIFTLLKDELLPSEHGGPLMFEVKIVIVEDEAQKGEFLKSIEKQFKRSCDSKELILVPFTVDSSKPVTQKEVLLSWLEGATAVVVVWTSFLENSTWVFELIDDWGHQRSDVPILFTEPQDVRQKGSLPKSFYTIPRDSKSLPWRLMQRANERGFEWRGAAGFNRIIVANASIILVTIGLIGAILLVRQRKSAEDLLANQKTTTENLTSNQKKTSENASRELFNLMSFYSKATFLQDYARKRTENGKEVLPAYEQIDISYWFIYDGIAQQFAATEPRDEHQTWWIDKNTAIGTAFSFGNHVAAGTITDASKKGERVPLQVWDNKGIVIADPDAALLVEHDRTIMVLACVSYHRVREHMVGICVFSEKGDIHFKDGYQNFLRDKARELYERAAPHLANHDIAPLPKSLPPP